MSKTNTEENEPLFSFLPPESFPPFLSLRGLKPFDVSTIHVSVVITIDVAVGCPFGGDDRGGRVLIFNGNRDISTQGLTPSQELKSAWRRAGSLSGYGFTLRGGQDLDNNQYPGQSVCLYTIPRIIFRILSPTRIPSFPHFPSRSFHHSLLSLPISLCSPVLLTSSRLSC